MNSTSCKSRIKRRTSLQLELLGEIAPARYSKRRSTGGMSYWQPIEHRSLFVSVSCKVELSLACVADGWLCGYTVKAGSIKHVVKPGALMPAAVYLSPKKWEPLPFELAIAHGARNAGRTLKHMARVSPRAMLGDIERLQALLSHLELTGLFGR